MQSVSFVLVFHDAAEVGAASARLAGLVEDAVRPLLRGLETAPNLRVGWAPSGTLVAYLAENAPEELVRVARLSRRGQIELLAAPRWGAPLHAVPWPDATRQLRLQMDALRARVGTPIRGAWLPFGAWDPVLPRLLASLGLRYSLVDQRLIGVSGCTLLGAGPVVAERDGHAIRLLALDGGLSRSALLAPTGMLGALRIHAAAERMHHAAALALEQLDPARVSALLGALAGASAWLRPTVPWQLVERLAPASRCNPPPGLPLPAALARLPPEMANRLRRDPSPFALGPDWQVALDRFDGADRLHAAGARVSGLVAALARHAARNADDVELRQALEGAQEALGQGQNASALEPGPSGRLWDPAARARAWTQLLRAEGVAWKRLGKGRNFVHSGDAMGDRPAREGLRVRTPDLQAVIDLSRGGALSELSLWDEHQLLNTLARQDRLDLQAAEDVLPVLLGEDGEPMDSLHDGSSPAPVEDGPTDEADFGPGEPPSSVDRLPRLAFQDRFFGEPLTLANLWRSQPPEIGDFADGAFRVERAEVVEGGVEVLLGREGPVRPTPDQEGHIRVSHHWTFSGHAPCLGRDTTLINRSREPLRCRYGTSLTLNVDGVVGPSRVLRLANDRPQPMDTATERAEVEALTLVFADLGFEVLLRVQPAVTLFCYPVRVPAPPDDLHPKPRLRQGSPFQGLCLNLVWPMHLWGEERRRVSLELEVRNLALRARRGAR